MSLHTTLCRLAPELASREALKVVVQRISAENGARIQRKAKLEDAWCSATGLWLALLAGESSASAGSADGSLDLRRREEQTKPWLEGSDGPLARLDVSIAHDGGLVVCTSSGSGGVGVDLLSVSRAQEAAAVGAGGLAVLARRVPAAMVARVSGAASAAERGVEFAVAWTLVEALAKGRGVSLYSEATRDDVHGAGRGGGGDAMPHAVSELPFPPAAWELPGAGSAQAAAAHALPVPPSFLLESWRGEGGEWRASTIMLPSHDAVMTVVHFPGPPMAWREASPRLV
jgi:hypothetical protein